MAVPIGAKDEDGVIYFIGNAEKQQLNDFFVAYS
jgi:hypothetical protein